MDINSCTGRIKFNFLCLPGMLNIGKMKGKKMKSKNIHLFSTQKTFTDSKKFRFKHLIS